MRNPSRKKEYHIQKPGTGIEIKETERNTNQELVAIKVIFNPPSFPLKT